MARRAVFGIVALIAATLGALSTPVDAWTRSPVRLEGEDRYATAVAISSAAHPSGATNAVVVSGTAFADGLSAGPLATRLEGPVLLTDPWSLPPVVAAELVRLGATSITVVGGAGAVSDDVLAEIAAATGVTPTRIEGDDRYETSAAVAATFPGGLAAAYIASGTSFFDALAGGAAASIGRVPLLLTDPAALPAATAAALRRLAPGEIRVLGDVGAVGEGVLGSLRAIVPSVRRIFGPDRYATAQAIATELRQAAGSPPTEVLVATTDSFADALAAAPLAAKRSAPVLLTAAPCAPWPTVDIQRDLRWPDVTILGGTSVVSRAAGAAVPCSPVHDGLLAPGLLLTTQVLPGPRVVHLVTIDRRQGFDLRTITGTGRIDGLFPTTGTARKLLAPLVAVNGDFFDPAGEPTHAFAAGGRLLRWPGSLRNTLVGFDPAKTTYGFFGKPFGGAELDQGETGQPIGIGLVNMRAPSGEEVALVTPEWTRAFPAGQWCRAALDPAGAPFVEATEPQRTIQPAAVRSAGCSGDALPRDADVLVAAAGSAAGASLSALRTGAPVRVRWKLHPTGQGVLDAIGANTTLVFGGQVADDVRLGSGTFFTRREARTAIAQRGQDGTILLAVVDKAAGWSIGMTPRELADHLVRLGAHDAANLDGGGSSAMAVNGVLTNRPSDGAERSINTALVVVPSGTDLAPFWRR